MKALALSLFMAHRRLVDFSFPYRVPQSSTSPFSASKMPHVLLFASLRQTTSPTRQVSGTVYDLSIGKINLTLPSPSFTATQLPLLLLQVCVDAIGPLILLSHFSYRFHSSVCLMVRLEISLLPLASSLLARTVALLPLGTEEG